MTTTICAPATASGPSAVALLRLSGPASLSILQTLTGLSNFTPRTQIFCSVYDGQTVLDKPLVTYFKAPHSFTGEDVVEFAVHGSPYIKGRLLELVCQAGAVPARRGEFSQRAFLNGKMDLLKAQGLCDLIASGNRAAHDLAMSSLDGKLTKKFETIKLELTELLAQIEVRLDDVDEEMTPLDESATQLHLQAVIHLISRLADTFSVGRFIKEGIKTAIIGAPNCGKSSLLNSLVGFDRAIVSPLSGTTRDTIEETIDIDGQRIILTDTAGIRDHALDPAEQEGMKRSLKAIEKADLVLFVADLTRTLTPEEKTLWQNIQTKGKPILLVLNKTDAAPNEVSELSQTQAITAVEISCKTGGGIENLKKAILSLTANTQTAEDGVMISNLRQFEGLLNAQTELETALLRLENQAGLEIYAEHIRAALLHLKELIGEVTPDDVLGVIFSKFCMGK